MVDNYQDHNDMTASVAELDTLMHIGNDSTTERGSDRHEQSSIADVLAANGYVDHHHLGEKKTEHHDIASSSVKVTRNSVPALSLLLSVPDIQGAIKQDESLEARKYCELSQRYVHVLKTMPDCAEKSLAAILPAIAGVGKLANNMGTTKKPNVVRLPHHAAANQTGK